MRAISRVLALDTAMNGCSVAVYNTETEKTFSASKAMVRGQAEVLVPMIQDVLKLAACDFDDIDLVVTTKGPGAFTGLRIGLSTAKSLALALGIPVIGLGTLDVLARQYLASHALKAKEGCIALVETKREDFYARAFDYKGRAISEPLAVSADMVMEMARGKKIVMVGDAVERFSALYALENITFHEIMLPDPEAMAKTGFALVSSEGIEREGKIEPLYLRAPDVSQPKSPQRVLADVSMKE